MWHDISHSHVQRYMQQNPYRLLAFSFLGVMIIGTILLMLPMASAQGQTTALVDAAFTAVSCVSVTGLTTVDTYYHWSLFGKIVMVILIQLGGLGIVSFTTIIALLLGKRVGLKKSYAFVRGRRTGGYDWFITYYEKVNALYLCY